MGNLNGATKKISSRDIFSKGGLGEIFGTLFRKKFLKINNLERCRFPVME